jgi:hypothetical protein
MRYRCFGFVIGALPWFIKNAVEEVHDPRRAPQSGIAHPALTSFWQRRYPAPNAQEPSLRRRSIRVFEYSSSFPWVSVARDYPATRYLHLFE